MAIDQQAPVPGVSEICQNLVRNFSVFVYECSVVAMMADDIKRSVDDLPDGVG